MVSSNSGFQSHSYKSNSLTLPTILRLSFNWGSLNIPAKIPAAAWAFCCWFWFWLNMLLALIAPCWLNKEAWSCAAVCPKAPKPAAAFWADPAKLRFLPNSNCSIWSPRLDPISAACEIPSPDLLRPDDPSWPLTPRSRSALKLPKDSLLNICPRISSSPPTVEPC